MRRRSGCVSTGSSTPSWEDGILNEDSKMEGRCSTLPTSIAHPTSTRLPNLLGIIDTVQRDPQNQTVSALLSRFAFSWLEFCGRELCVSPNNSVKPPNLHKLAFSLLGIVGEEDPRRSERQCRDHDRCNRRACVHDAQDRWPQVPQWCIHVCYPLRLALS